MRGEGRRAKSEERTAEGRGQRAEGSSPLIPSPSTLHAPRSTLFGRTKSVFLREARTELRSRYALNSIGMFALITLMVVGISSAGTNIPHRMHAGLLWLILLFSAMTGLARVFVRETEARTQDALRLTADPSALFFGKALFNGALLLALQGIIVPLYSLMTSLAIRDYVLFLTMQILGNLGLTVASTLLAALVAKAGGRSALFPVLALPILLPLIMAVIGGTYAALAPDPKVVQGVGWVPNPIEIQQTAWEAGGTYVRMAVAFIGMLGPASFLLFEFVWNED